MWYQTRIALNKINTRPLAEQIDALIKSGQNTPAVLRYKKIDQQWTALKNQINQMREQNAPMWEAVPLINKANRMTELVGEALDDAHEEFDPIHNKINDLIASSGLFTRIAPPKLMLSIMPEGTQGAYSPQDNILIMDPQSFFRDSFPMANILAHELTHAMQTQYDGHGMTKGLEKLQAAQEPLENTEADTFEEYKKIEDAKFRNYSNTRVERQAFYQNIIGELANKGRPPMDYAGFTQFMAQSPTWEMMNDMWQPEVKRDAIMAIYKHYSELPTEEVPQIDPAESTIQ